jgi:hypothetical protein
MDRQAFNFAKGELRELRWKHPDGETRLTYSAEGKYLVSRDPDFVSVPADSTEAAYKFNYVSTLAFNSFLPSGREKEADFTKPALVLTAVDLAGAPSELLITGDTTSNAGRYYAIRPGQPRPIGIFFKSHYDRLTGRYDALLAPKE